MIERQSKLPEKHRLIDVKSRFEAERALLEPNEQDIEDYLFLYNAVVSLLTVRDKINSMVETINTMLDVIDPIPTTSKEDS